MENPHRTEDSFSPRNPTQFGDRTAGPEAKFRRFFDPGLVDALNVGKDSNIGASRDQSPSMAAESEAGEERFRALAENLPQMTFTCTPAGNKTYCSRTYLAYTGAASMEEIDDRWAELLHPADRQAVAAAWKNSIESGSPYSVQYRMRRHDGVYRHQLARAVPVRNPAGEISQWVGTITDIHDQKLTEEMLRRAEKLAAASRIAASVAHEINNPLASVTNSLYLAMQAPNLDAVTRQYLKVADQELQRIAHVTTQALRFHHQSTAAVTTSLDQLMDSALAIYSHRMRAAAIKVERQYDAGTTLHCRADEIRQAFGHIICNSLDAMPLGGRLVVRIRRSHSFSGPGSAGVRITIADSGHGIPADFIPQVFEAFTSTRDPTGTGLGLWVVDTIVRQHSGCVAVRTRTQTLNHGTVLSIFLPLLAAAQAIP